MGIGLVVWGAWLLKDVRRNATWPATPGRIVSSEVASSSATGRTRVYAQIRYLYEVGGVEYEGDQIGDTRSLATLAGEFFDLGAARKRADAHVRRYPEGTLVDVYYDPRDPRRAVLERGGLAVPGLTLAAGLLLLVLAWRDSG